MARHARLLGPVKHLPDSAEKRFVVDERDLSIETRIARKDRALGNSPAVARPLILLVPENYTVAREVCHFASPSTLPAHVPRSQIGLYSSLLNLPGGLKLFTGSLRIRLLMLWILSVPQNRN